MQMKKSEEEKQPERSVYDFHNTLMRQKMKRVKCNSFQENHLGEQSHLCLSQNEDDAGLCVEGNIPLPYHTNNIIVLHYMFTLLQSLYIVYGFH